MGRRAVPKIDPQVDLSRHFFSLEQLAKPLPVRELFGRTAPLEVEVGSGKGLFLFNASAQFPERDFLGIEIAAKYARLAAFRLAKSDRGNARVIHGDGIALFQECLPDESVDAVHVYFPDPWWKARHRKRRVMRDTFVGSVYRVLKPSGVLHFWTDVEEYFDSTLDMIRTVQPELRHTPVAQDTALNDMDYRTHFERRMRHHDHPVFRSRFAKPGASGTD